MIFFIYKIDQIQIKKLITRIIKISRILHRLKSKDNLSTK